MEELLTQRKKSFLNISSLIDNYQYYLAPIARICLLGLFIDDGIRVALQWTDQNRFVAVSWGGSEDWWPASVFVLLVIVGQTVPCIFLLLLRRAILPSCLALVFMVVYNSILYHVHYDLRFLSINISILGGLLMLAAETQSGEQDPPNAGDGLHPGPPKDKRTKSWLMLVGRTLLPLMFISLLRWDPTHPIRMLELCVASVLMVLVVVGFKTRLCSIALALWLSFINITANAWWQMPVGHPYREFAKFDFFQTLSVVGGLLLTVANGPGQLSLDSYNKKNW